MTNILTESVFLVANRPIQLYAALDNGNQYVSIVRHSISITEVNKDDVPQMLMRRCGCCDDVWTCFRVANASEVERWKLPLNE